MDGKETVVLNVFALGDENIVINAEQTAAYARDFNAVHEGIQLTIIEDGSETVQDNLSTMTGNGIAGLSALLVLALFLESLPGILGSSQNSGGHYRHVHPVRHTGFDHYVYICLCYCIGYPADDGVVIGENIFQWAKKKGVSPAEAALEGTMQMVVPVLISLGYYRHGLLLVYVPAHPNGGVGEMAFVVIAVLLIAALESFFFLPAHLAHSRALRGNCKPTKIERWFNGAVEWVNNRAYLPVFRSAVTKWRLMPFVTVAVFIGLLVAAFELMGSGVVAFTFFPNLDDKAVFIELDMPPGTPLEVTTDKLNLIAAAAQRTKEKLNKEYDQELIKFVEVITGPRPNQGKLRITYLNGEERDISSFDLTEAIREEAPAIPEAIGLVYGIGATNAVFGKPVSIALRGKDLTALRAAREQLKNAMRERTDIKTFPTPTSPGFRKLQSVSIPPESGWV